MKVWTDCTYYTQFLFAATTQYIGRGAVSGFACVFKYEHNGRNTYTIHVTKESLCGFQNYPTKKKIFYFIHGTMTQYQNYNY